jgi:hypothetical protein
MWRRVYLQTATICSSWFLTLGFFYSEDGGDTLLRNVGLHKIYTAPNPRKWRSYCIREVPRFNLGRNTNYLEDVNDSPQFLPGNSERVSYNQATTHSFLIISNILFNSIDQRLYTEYPRRKGHVLGGHNIGHYKQKNCKYTWVLFRTISEIELFHCTVYRRATRHVLTRVAKCIDVDGGILKNVLR